MSPFSLRVTMYVVSLFPDGIHVIPKEARPDATTGRQAFLIRSCANKLLKMTLPWVKLSSIVGVYWSDYSKSPDTGLHYRVAFAPPIASHLFFFVGQTEREHP